MNSILKINDQRYLPVINEFSSPFPPDPEEGRGGPQDAVTARGEAPSSRVHLAPAAFIFKNMQRE